MNQNVLLVEDDENDVLFMRHAFQAVGILALLQVAQDGEEAIDYLSGNGGYANRKAFPFPNLILLDLKLPKVMGFGVLKWVREQPEFKPLIVIMLSSSLLALDIETAYQLGANAYLVKPSSLLKRAEMAAAIKGFWLDFNQSPAKSGKSAEVVASVK